MNLARVLRSLPLFVALAAALPAAPVDDAQTALRLGVDEISAALRDRPAQENVVTQLDSLADKHFAFSTTTRLAVGPAWRDFSAEQQAKAIRLFSQLMVRTYADRLRGELSPDITYGAATELRPGRIEIPTTVKSKGQSYAVAYRLELDPAPPGRWRVYDVIAEGVSLIANYRAQFAPIVEKSGAPGLLRTLETKLAEPVPPAS